MTTAQVLGARLRQLRKARHLTLSQLAGISGVALSTISKIENGTLSPTLDKILRLADGLKISVGHLIGEDVTDDHDLPPNSRFLPVHMEDGVVIDTQNYEYRYLCSELKNKRMVPMRIRLKARTIRDFGTPERHRGEEFLLVMEGTVKVHTDFYAPVILQRGEGIYLDSTMGHAYLSVGEQDAEAVCICTESQRNQDST